MSERWPCGGVCWASLRLCYGELQRVGRFRVLVQCVGVTPWVHLLCLYAAMHCVWQSHRGLVPLMITKCTSKYSTAVTEKCRMEIITLLRSRLQYVFWYCTLTLVPAPLIPTLLLCCHVSAALYMVLRNRKKGPGAIGTWIGEPSLHLVTHPVRQRRAHARRATRQEIWR